MISIVHTGLAVAALFLSAAAPTTSVHLGTEEFGLSPKQLVVAIDKVESLISACMREQGFEYVAADFNTVRRGMASDKKLPGMSEREFIAKYGYGVSTLYTGEPPQLAKGYSPGKEGLGARNVDIYRKLSPQSQVAYDRALFGANSGATFAVSLEMENFAFTGGCTKKAVEQVFQPDQLKDTYYNPKDALVNKDPRMQAVLRKFAAEMRKAGYDYTHPDNVEQDIYKRLAALTRGGAIPVSQMTPEQRAALKQLQAYELQVAQKSVQLSEDLVDPVKDKIEEELFGRTPQ
ncbi:hypothetical protein [Janthinobacterium fluminis]|uniref:Uncharacterized protein n=1 Tax=Janthinobacterium fluminis TaxID=2987524 RepID=A0ABT5JV48_9BURK|nr:hypothetical protein [Janthinobacterium fluminis]MDC8756620.1 hypothetical protein [Janthinobacterium fluminis]